VLCSELFLDGPDGEVKSRGLGSGRNKASARALGVIAKRAQR